MTACHEAVWHLMCHSTVSVNMVNRATKCQYLLCKGFDAIPRRICVSLFWLHMNAHILWWISLMSLCGSIGSTWTFCADVCTKSSTCPSSSGGYGGMNEWHLELPLRYKCCTLTREPGSDGSVGGKILKCIESQCFTEALLDLPPWIIKNRHFWSHSVHDYVAICLAKIIFYSKRPCKPIIT